MTNSVGRRRTTLFFFLLLACFWFSLPAAALDIELSGGGGYDDNPRQEKGSEGAFFSQIELDFDWTITRQLIPATAISFYGFAAGRNYSGLDDNWQLSGGLASATNITEIPGTLSFFTEFASYRNQLVSDDDYDSFSMGCDFIWFTSPQLSLETISSIAWEDYRDPITSNRSPRKKAVNPGNGNHASGSPVHHNFGDRNDRRFTTSLKSLYAFSPDFDSTGTIFWRYRHSSIDAECRTAYGLNLSLNWHPVPAIELNWQLGGERVPYKYRYHKEKRTETIYNTGFTISCFLNDFTLQSGWDWNKQNSVVNEDDYQRNQWQFILKYSF